MSAPEPASLTQDQAASLMRRATYAAVAAAMSLVIMKVGAWWITDSVALLSTTIDSALDAGASLVNLWAVHHALQPADEQHRFGHGKAEPLAGLAQSAFVAGSAILLVIQGLSRLFQPTEVREELVGIGVMIASIAITLALVSFQKYVIRRSNSVAITADSLHYTGDVLMNASVIGSLLVSLWVNAPWVDPLCGVGIALFLLRNAWEISTSSLDLLMDKEFPAEDRDKILDIARAVSGVEGAHDLRTRSSGQMQFIQLHLELNRDLPLIKAHAIADKVEREILKVFPQAEVIIHQDPSGIREKNHSPLAYSDHL